MRVSSARLIPNAFALLLAASGVLGATATPDLGAAEALYKRGDFRVALVKLADAEHSPRLTEDDVIRIHCCLLYTSPSPRDGLLSRMPSSA